METQPCKWFIGATRAALICMGLQAGALMATDGSEIKLLDIDPTQFENSHVITNPWWPLTPGNQYILDGYTMNGEEKVPHKIISTVTDLTKMINGIRAVVIYERDYSAGELAEAELTFFAQDKEGNVWHLGQYTEVYETGEFVGGGAWMVGHVDGARAGIMIPANPKEGTPAYSEGFAPAPFNWTDCGRVVKMGQKVTVPAGTYDNVMVIEEYASDNPTAIQLKGYAKGIGGVRVGWSGADATKETLELTKFAKLNPKELKEMRDEALKLEKRAAVYGTTASCEVTPSQQVAR